MGILKTKKLPLFLLRADEILSAVVMRTVHTHTQLRAFYFWYMIQGKQEARLDQ